MDNNSESIRVLLLSDIHMSPGGISNVDFAKKHLNWDDEKSEKYDFVFVSGDIANLPNKTSVADP